MTRIQKGFFIILLAAILFIAASFVINHFSLLWCFERLLYTCTWLMFLSLMHIIYFAVVNPLYRFSGMKRFDAFSALSLLAFDILALFNLYDAIRETIVWLVNRPKEYNLLTTDERFNTVIFPTIRKISDEQWEVAQLPYIILFEAVIVACFTFLVCWGTHYVQDNRK